MIIPRLPKEFSHPMRIGEGAYASVYRVRQSALDRWVAVKIIYECSASKRHKLLQEARVQASISAECIPQVYDAFEYRKTVCIVMQWIRGIPLSMLLETTLSESQRQNLASAFLKTLSALHNSGYAHRDIKPANVIVSPEGQLFLVDFGFSRYAATGDRSKSLIAKGTPAFMAPELWQFGGNVDLMRADVYSAGRVLQRILSGCSVTMGSLSRALENDPLRRFSTGVQFNEQWCAEFREPTGEKTWIKLVRSFVSEYFSIKLLLAAKQLLYAGRSEEGYWLLVECIEEDGENCEALKLLEEFPARIKMHKQRVHMYVLGALATVLMISAVSFMIGKRSAMYPADISSPQLRRFRISSAVETVQGAVCENLPLRVAQKQPEGSMTASIVVSSRSVCKVVVDGREISIQNEKKRIQIEPGTRSIAMYDSGGALLWKETAAFLPFQVKKITISNIK